MKNHTYSKEIASMVHKFLDEKDYPYDFDDDLGIFNFENKTKSSFQGIWYLAKVEDNKILFYGYGPYEADPRDAEMMVRISQFICRINYGLTNGSFQLDFNDGEIIFKSFVDCDGLIPSVEVIQNSILYIEMVIERYTQGIIDIVFGYRSVEDTIEKFDKSEETELKSFPLKYHDVKEEMLENSIKTMNNIFEIIRSDHSDKEEEA